MIAPRKKLWSTPVEALQEAANLLNIQENDVVYDIGCGDGNFLSLIASTTQSIKVTLKGVEIEEERAISAELRIKSCAGPLSTVNIVAANALEVDYSDGSCFFMYLIPRGLRLIFPLLSRIEHPIRVVTFMNPLPGLTPTKSIKIQSAGHSDSQWPLFFYDITDPTVL